MAVSHAIPVVNSASSSNTGATATFSSQSIGSANAKRRVWLLVTSELASGSINSATYNTGSGATAMTAGGTASANFGSQYARLFYADIATGTTADFVVTFGANPTSTSSHISVMTTQDGGGVLFGTSSSTDMDATAPLTTTAGWIIPTDGAFLAVACGATNGTGKTWSGATESADADGTTMRHCTAWSTTGAVGAVTCTGGTNGEDGAMMFVSVWPEATAFGDVTGVITTGAAAITDPQAATGEIVVEVDDLVIASLSSTNTSSVVSGVTDNLGNTYSVINSAAGNGLAESYYSRVTNAGTITSISFDISAGSSNDVAIVCAGYKGPFASSPLDIVPTETFDSSSTYTATATGTLSQADELIVGTWGNRNAGTYSGPGASSRLDAQMMSQPAGGANTVSAALTSLVVASTSSVTLTLNGTASSNGGQRVGTFKKGTVTPTGTGAITLSGAALSATGAETFTATGAATLLGVSVAASGASADPASGEGAITLLGVTLAATGAETFTGAGDLTLSGVTLDATGAETFTGAGALTLASVTLDAAGTESIPGAGAVTLLSVTLAASGESVAEVPGAGDITLTGVSLAASALETIPGAGDITLLGPTIEASGALTFTSTGAITLLGVDLAALGAHPFVGNGAITLSGVSLEASGAETFTSSGDVTLSSVILAGTGSHPFVGDGAITLLGPTIAATGSLEIAGTAALTLSGVTIAAAGASNEISNGDGAITLLSISISAQGAHPFVGNGAITLSGVSVAATGTEQFTSTGAISLFEVLLAGQGSSVAGAGAIMLSSVQLAALGSETITSTGALTLLGPTIAASGAESIPGAGAIILSGVALAASGAETFTSTGALALLGPTIAATGSEIFTSAGAITLSDVDIAASGLSIEGTGGVGVIVLLPISIAASGDSTGGSVSGAVAERMNPFIASVGAMMRR